LGLVLWASLAGEVRAQTSATFGDVIRLGTTPSDIVLDENRKRLYLVNSAAGVVNVYDYSSQNLIGSIPVGITPLAATISMDGGFLYVSNHDSSSLTVINLGTGIGTVVTTVPLPAKPQGIEVGADGRVLICTDGAGTSSLANTLLIYDSTQALSSQVLAVPFPPAPPTPPTLQQLQARPTTQFAGKLQRTPDGKYIVGVSSITNNTSTVVYVYETASGTVLQSRIVVGQSSVLSMSPDGATFMAGFTLYDRATLNVIAQQNTANAPFAMSSSFATTYNVGGSTFSPDGSTLYSAFNTAALTTPAPAPQAATLLISDPRSLGIRLGINLPESLVAKMVITSDGTDAWGLSSSGAIHLPLSTLFNYPILMPESTTVFLAQDDCNPGLALATLNINNIGGGKLTFAVPQTIQFGSAAVIVTANSGVAPASIKFTMDPGRSGVIRNPGTNLYTGSGASNTGAAVNIQLVSPNAINVPPMIRVFMNYRDATMRGMVYPVPTVPNSGTGAVSGVPVPGGGGAAATAYQGLWDIALDEPRQRVYITNAGYNRIEVFDTQQMQFLPPIPVGQLPHQMAMGLDGSTLYVSNTGGESIVTVDLNQQQVTGSIQFPPIPRAGNANVNSVSALAVGLSGLQFVMNNPNGNTGTLWEVIGNNAVPRTGTTVTGVASSGAQTPLAAPTQTLLGTSDGTGAILLAGNGTAYLYNALTDTYTASRQLFNAPIIGYYGPLGTAPNGNYLLANGLVLNNSLTVIGGAASPGQVTITPPAGPFMPPNVGVTSTGLRNVAALAPLDQNVFVRMTTAVRTNLTSTTSDDNHTTLEAVETRTGATTVAARLPENPVISEFGTARTAMPPHQMVVDSQYTVYALTVSGLSVVPLTPASASTQPQISSDGGVLNANDGTANFSPGSFINVMGANLASTAVATTLPPPTVLGGSCVLFDGMAIPLLATSSGQITAQIPTTVRPGVNVVQVRSLATAQRSQPMVVTVQQP
jgi:DNA-binding beta-propeller fold protein YncE